jgi:hypothetical protein
MGTMSERPEPCWWARGYEMDLVVFKCDEAQARIVDNAPEALRLLREKSRYNAGYTRGNCHCPMMDPGMERFIEPDGSCWDCKVRALIARVDGKAG